MPRNLWSIPKCWTAMRTKSLWSDIQFFLTWIFSAAAPVVGPPTSLQYKSNLGLPASSSPQVAVAEILDSSARLKYGGLKLNPGKRSCPPTQLKKVADNITTTAKRWASLILLAMFRMRDPSRCWGKAARRSSCHLQISIKRALGAVQLMCASLTVKTVLELATDSFRGQWFQTPGFPSSWLKLCATLGRSGVDGPCVITITTTKRWRKFPFLFLIGSQFRSIY